MEKYDRGLEMIQDVLSEWKLLAAFKNYPGDLYTTTRNIFTDERPAIFDAMRQAYAKYTEVTLMGVQEFYEDVPSELSTDIRVNPRTLINHLVNIARKRQLEEASHVLLTLSRDQRVDENKVRNVLNFDPIVPAEDISMHTGALHLQTDIMRKRNSDYVFAQAPVKVFNALMGGEWPRRSLTILKALPGTGKTSMALNAMVHLAEVNKYPVHFWSLEMGKQQLLARMLAANLNIDNTRITMGVTLSEHELALIEKESARLQALPITVNETIPTLEQVIQETHYLAMTEGVRVFFYDYIQIARVNKYGNKNQDLGYLALTMKELAKKYDVSFVALSQINDQGEVRDSGEVEQVADISVLLYPSKEDTGSNDYNIVRARWDKNRFGAAGKDVALLFYGAYQKFADMGSLGDQDEEDTDNG